MFKIQVRLKSLDTADSYQHLNENCSGYFSQGTVSVPAVDCKPKGIVTLL